MVLTAVAEEITTIPQALVNTCLGMGTVFAVLILISFIISLFGVIPKLFDTSKKEDTKPEAPAPVQPAAPAPVQADETDQSQVVAAIAAAVAAYMSAETGTPVSADGLVIRSIKKRTM